MSTVWLDVDSNSEYILLDGDILFARSGASVGKTFLFKKDYGLSAFAGYLIRARTKKYISSKYLFYYSQSSAYDEWKRQVFIQSTIQNIGADKYNQLPVVIPPISEQREIVTFLDEKTAAIDLLIAKKNQLVTELASLKKSLIFEYVTGKKAVQL